MSTSNRFKAPLVLLLTLVLLCAGVAVLVGVFGLLVKLFGHG
jgi:predicted membrane-bound mannosyltransferase